MAKQGKERRRPHHTVCRVRVYSMMGGSARRGGGYSSSQLKGRGAAAGPDPTTAHAAPSLSNQAYWIIRSTRPKADSLRSGGGGGSTDQASRPIVAANKGKEPPLPPSRNAARPESATAETQADARRTANAGAERSRPTSPPGPTIASAKGRVLPSC